MTLPVVYRRRVQHDLAGAFDWYELQGPQLGEQFLVAVQSTLRAIGQYPEMFTAKFAGPSSPDFRSRCSTRSSLDVLSFSGFYTPRGIQRSGQRLGARHANHRTDTDRFAADHAER